MIKMIGSVLIIVSCGYVGFGLAFSYIQEIKTMRRLVHILDYMACELEYRLTPLTELCIQIGADFKQLPGPVFREMALELETQTRPDVFACMDLAIQKVNAIPAGTKKILK